LNPWNGELRDPWLLGHLGDRFGPDRVWSASQLESYAQCPFLFLVGRVLGLEAFEEADEATTALTFGGVAHTLLERFYPALLEAGAFPARFDEAAQELFERIAGEVFAELERGGDAWLGIPALWAVTKRGLVRDVGEYLAWELARFKGARPHLFEYRFGDDESDAVVIEGPDLRGERQELRLRGRIDRVDERGAGEGATYEIVDYKSKSMPTTGWYDDGAALQIPLYMLALAQRLGRGVAGGCYRSIKGRGNGARAKWASREFERALRIALSIPARVRAGKFEPQATKSSGWQWYWPGLDVCRVQAVVEERCRFDEPDDAEDVGGEALEPNGRG
jgi:ATP-dependent helicase/DNAse subunit B